MARSTFMVVLLAVFAGAAAGMAVQFLSPGPEAVVTGPAADAGRDAKQTEVENLVNRDADRITQTEIAVEELRSENADLRTLIAAQAKRIEEFEESAGATGDRSGSDLKIMGPDGKPISLGGHPTMMRFGSPGKGFKLAGLPEEEKWARLREGLSLDSYQETELKQIAIDYRKTMNDMFKTGDDGFKIGSIDLGKIMKARTDADERVKNLLSEEQHKKYEKENYGAAVGIGGSTTVSVSTSFGTTGSSEGK